MVGQGCNQAFLEEEKNMAMLNYYNVKTASLIS